jgi:hypothetical protein
LKPNKIRVVQFYDSIIGGNDHLGNSFLPTLKDKIVFNAKVNSIRQSGGREVKVQRSKLKGERSKFKGQRSEFKGQRSKLKGERSKFKGQRSEFKGQRSKLNSIGQSGGKVSVRISCEGIQCTDQNPGLTYILVLLV